MLRRLAAMGTLGRGFYMTALAALSNPPAVLDAPRNRRPQSIHPRRDSHATVGVILLAHLHPARPRVRGGGPRRRDRLDLRSGEGFPGRHAARRRRPGIEPPASRRPGGRHQRHRRLRIPGPAARDLQGRGDDARPGEDHQGGPRLRRRRHAGGPGAEPHGFRRADGHGRGPGRGPQVYRAQLQLHLRGDPRPAAVAQLPGPLPAHPRRGREQQLSSLRGVLA